MKMVLLIAGNRTGEVTVDCGNLRALGRLFAVVTIRKGLLYACWKGLGEVKTGLIGVRTL